MPRVALICAALAVLTLAAFHGVLSSSFVHYDDDLRIGGLGLPRRALPRGS